MLEQEEGLFILKTVACQLLSALLTASTKAARPKLSKCFFLVLFYHPDKTKTETNNPLTGLIHNPVFYQLGGHFSEGH